MCGFLSEKFSDKALLRLGIGLCIAGIFCLSLPLPSALYYGAIALAGLGCALIFLLVICVLILILSEWVDLIVAKQQ